MSEPLSPIATIDNEIFSALMVDRPIKSVLIGPELWLGFLLQIDLPGTSAQLMTTTHLNGLEISRKYLKKAFNSQNFFEEFPFFIKLNAYIKGVRVVLYPVIPPV